MNYPTPTSYPYSLPLLPTHLPTLHSSYTYFSLLPTAYHLQLFYSLLPTPTFTLHLHLLPTSTPYLCTTTFFPTSLHCVPYFPTSVPYLYIYFPYPYPYLSLLPCPYRVKSPIHKIFKFCKITINP